MLQECNSKYVVLDTKPGQLTRFEECLFNQKSLFNNSPQNLWQIEES